MKKIVILALMAGLTGSALADGTSNSNYNPNSTTTTVVPMSLQTIQNNDKSISYSDWKSSLSCIYNDNGRIYRYVATVAKGSTVPTITLYDTGSAVSGSKSFVTIAARTDLPAGSVMAQKGLKNMTLTDNYINVATVPMNGGYTFSTIGSSGTRTTIVTPSGFYYSLNGAQYMKGC